MYSKNFKKGLEIINTLHITNDIAEWDVKLMKEYNLAYSIDVCYFYWTKEVNKKKYIKVYLI